VRQERGRGLRFREDMGRHRRGLDALPEAIFAVASPSASLNRRCCSTAISCGRFSDDRPKS
jgi:hypothetical protein